MYFKKNNIFTIILWTIVHLSIVLDLRCSLNGFRACKHFIVIGHEFEKILLRKYRYLEKNSIPFSLILALVFTMMTWVHIQKVCRPDSSISTLIPEQLKFHHTLVFILLTTI